MNHLIKIILAVLLGTILCAILSGGCWYHIVYNYYTPSNNLGLGSSKDFSAGISAISTEGNSPVAVTNESYYTKILGLPNVDVADDQGNQTIHDGDIFISNIPGLQYEVIGDNALLLTLPKTGTHYINFQAGNNPINLEIVKGVGNKSPNLAVRYRDVILPQGSKARLTITEQGVITLQYDSAGDGSFASTVSPTVNLQGTNALDTTPPTINISIVPQGLNATATITATDSESGVGAVYYSLDGVTFNQYTTPFSINHTAGKITVTAIASDNAANRSGVYRKTFNFYTP